MGKDDLEILATPSQTANLCFFAASVSFLERKAECHSAKEAKGSPLFSALFELPWVAELGVEGNKLVVKKNDQGPWPDQARQVGKIIRQLYAEKTPFFTQSYINSLPSAQHAGVSSVKINEANVNSELGRRIQKVLTDHIAPSLASHGGHVTLVDVHSETAYFYFGGGCQGCSQASVTVKDGIERTLLKHIPEIKKVVDVTDHKRGENPYFK